MGTQSLRLKVGSIYTKGPGKIYYFRYQVEGHRKTVSLQTTSRAEALKKAQTFQPVIQSSSMDVIAAHVSYARGAAGCPAGYAPCRCMELLRTAT